MSTTPFKNDQEMIAWTSSQAETLLSPLGNRWLHVQGVARQAQHISEILNTPDQPYLIAAAYLHDIGYAPVLMKTQFHPIDGANYLQSHGLDRLVSLVAYHSEAQFEAALRGLSSELERFPREYSPVGDALTHCDLTTSTTGEEISFEERIANIISRYGKEDIVTKALHQAIPAWTQAIQNTQQALHHHR